MFKQKILIIFVFFIFFSNCVYVSKNQDRPQKDIIEARKKTIVVVQKYVNTKLSRVFFKGKGVLITPRQILTAKHVISADPGLMPLIKVDQVHSVLKDSIRLLPDIDLAILSLKKDIRPSFELPLAQTAEPQPIFWFVYSSADSLKLFYGQITGLKIFSRWAGHQIAEIKTANKDLIIIRGDSGTPLFNFQGELVGILVAHDLNDWNRGYAILTPQFKDNEVLKSVIKN